MNQENGRQAPIEALLEKFSRITLPPEVERRLEARVHEFYRQPQPHTERVMPAPQRRIPRRFVRASVATSLSAMVLAALFVAFGNQGAWAQVAKAMRSKPWVRWTLQLPKSMPVPEGFEAPESWFSAENKVFARRALNQAAQYLDLASQETYDYSAQTKTVNRSLTSDIDNVDVGHFETMLRFVSEGDRALKFPDSPIQIVGRTCRDVPDFDAADGDRRWTEYTFACRDSRRTPQDYQVTFRVDPKTHLPVEMRSTEKFSSNDPAGERIYAIDYPEAGPGDIYALGVPRDAMVVDRRRAVIKTAREIKEFLAAYVEARKKPLETFAMTALMSDPRTDFSDIRTAFRTNGAGDQMQVEEVDSRQLMEFREKFWARQISRPVDADRMVWWSQQVEGMKFNPMPRGDEFLPHRIGYPLDLTFGAPPIDNPDCRVTLDRQPVLGPPETVLLKIRTETTLGFNDCFYWIAPERDYLVLRHEIHFSKDHAAWNNSTQIIDEVKQSPGGRWYATAVRAGRIEKHGDDLSAEPVAAYFKTGMEIGPVTTSSYRYLVDFK
jgi:hypothetical protein